MACLHGEDEVLVRVKLVRGQKHAAVCVAEAVSHALLRAYGFRVAPAFGVKVTADLADSLTSHYSFDSAVEPGWHWGTLFLDAVSPEPEQLTRFLKETDARLLLDLYLVDTILGNPDRTTRGNVLLVDRETGAGFDILPIDHSESFFHPDSVLNEAALHSKKERTVEHFYQEMETTIYDSTTTMVEQCFDKAAGLEGGMREFVNACRQEWIDRSGASRDLLEEFLEDRVKNLPKLANKGHWIDIASYDGGNFAIFGG